MIVAEVKKFEATAGLERGVFLNEPDKIFVQPQLFQFREKSVEMRTLERRDLIAGEVKHREAVDAAASMKLVVITVATGEAEVVKRPQFVLGHVEVLDYITDDHTIWEREPIERLAQEGNLVAYQHHGFWQPMDTLRDKVHLEEWTGPSCCSGRGASVTEVRRMRQWRRSTWPRGSSEWLASSKASSLQRPTEEDAQAGILREQALRVGRGLRRRPCRGG